MFGLFEKRLSHVKELKLLKLSAIIFIYLIIFLVISFFFFVQHVFKIRFDCYMINIYENIFILKNSNIALVGPNVQFTLVNFD